ncbi:MAG: phosphotransferase [Myxococcota bacterium]
MTPSPAVLRAFDLTGSAIRRVETGLIHRTFKVDAPSGKSYALQAVSPIFQPEVHEDIEAVTRHLAHKGLLTPLLLRSTSGELFVREGEEIWRALSWIPGRSFERVERPRVAAEGARLLGRFHRALSDLRHTFKARRLGVHDTPKHLRTLEEAVATHVNHRLRKEVAPLALEILTEASTLPDLSEIPERIVHGDPKISNVLFAEAEDSAIALVDLDTIAPMQLPLELGDALRSWCNPGGEDAAEVRFDVDIFAAALAGYAAEGPSLSPAEIAAIGPTTRMIMLELAARFLADALNERYFGWDQTRFGSRGEHNLVRAKGQLRLAQDFDRRPQEIAAAVVAAFAR